MFTFIKGDLLNDDAQALVNTVNTVGVMGKGIALQFKEKFPDNYNIYRKLCKEGKFNIGQLLITKCNLINTDKFIINFPTKTTWKKPSEYEYIEKGLIELKKKIIELEIKSIAIPPLGSHNGGLDWNRVKQMILKALNDIECDIRIYEPSEAIIERIKSERIKLTPARAMLLDVLHDVVSYGEFISLFTAEKVVYFLQRFGAQKEFNIKFDRGYYGPYSGGKIAHVMYYLNGSYIKGMAGMQKKPFESIWILDDTIQYVNDFLNDPNNIIYKTICNKTKNFLRGYYANYSLELLSTIDYILNEQKKQNIENLDNIQLINYINDNISDWNSRKQMMFTGSKYIPKILQHLQNYNMLNLCKNN